MYDRSAFRHLDDFECINHDTGDTCEIILTEVRTEDGAERWVEVFEFGISAGFCTLGTAKDAGAVQDFFLKKVPALHDKVEEWAERYV